jgi:hypothetical protein
MLGCLLGDVLRILAGDLTQGEIAGRQTTQGMRPPIAAIMLTPTIMVVLSLLLHFPAIRWACQMPGRTTRFLIAVSFVFRALFVWYARTWPAPAWRQAGVPA